MKAWLVAGLFASLGVVVCPCPQAKAQELVAENRRPDASQLRAERWYAGGVRALKAQRFREALDLLERAIPHKGMSQNLLFNLTHASQGVRSWAKVALYGQAFIHREKGGKDAVEVSRMVDAAFAELAKNGKVPVTYRFDVKPEAIDVLVNGVPVANAAVNEVRLLPGRYVLSASRDHFAPWSETLEVVEGSGPQTVVRALQPIIYEGKLKITTDPAEGVLVYMDEQLIGTTPLDVMTLQTGRRYLFRFEKPGYDRWWRYIEVFKDETLELNPVMEALPSVGQSTR